MFPIGNILAILAALAGALMIVFPRMDQPWLDALEHAVPVVQEAFLTSGERETRRDSIEAIGTAKAELTRLHAMEQDDRWGKKKLDPEYRERLRQYLAGRSEIMAGDQLVLKALQAKARARQRYALGIPLVLAGVCALWVLRRAKA